MTGSVKVPPNLPMSPIPIEPTRVAAIEILPQFFVLQAPNRTVPFKALNAAQAVKVCTAVFRDSPGIAAGAMVSWRLSSTDTTLTWHFQADMQETSYALTSVKDTSVEAEVAIETLSDAFPEALTLDRWRYLLETPEGIPKLPTTVALEADLVDYLSIPF